LAWHFDDVGGSVADGVEVSEQRFEIERFAAADGAGKIGVIVGRAQAAVSSQKPRRTGR
jgi:hypothetical protein